jgi:ribosomal protein S18 acetylase RimI-like enzyme
MKVRRLQSEDFELAFAAIQTVKQPTAHPTFSPEYFKMFLAGSDNVLIVAEQGGVPAGFLLAYMLERVDRDQKMVCLYELDIAEPYRRQGIGRALIETLKSLCKQENAMEAWVVTNRSNLAAVGLYESTGATADPGGDEVVYVFDPETWVSASSGNAYL